MRVVVQPAVLGGVEQALGHAHANLLMADIPAADRVPEVLRRNRIDGVILKGATDHADHTDIDPRHAEDAADHAEVWDDRKSRVFRP